MKVKFGNLGAESQVWVCNEVWAVMLLMLLLLLQLSINPADGNTRKSNNKCHQLPRFQAT